jgi:hypothetical protein
MTCIDVRYGYARKLLLAATLGLGMLTAFSHPGRAFASLSTTDQGAPAATAPAAQLPPPPAPASAAPIVQAPPPAQLQQQRRAAAQQQAMQRRQMAGQGFNDPERAARRRAFVGGVLIGIVAASRMRR